MDSLRNLNQEQYQMSNNNSLHQLQSNRNENSELQLNQNDQENQQQVNKQNESNDLQNISNIDNSNSNSKQISLSKSKFQTNNRQKQISKRNQRDKNFTNIPQETNKVLQLKYEKPYQSFHSSVSQESSSDQSDEGYQRNHLFQLNSNKLENDQKNQILNQLQIKKNNLFSQAMQNTQNKLNQQITQYNNSYIKEKQIAQNISQKQLEKRKGLQFQDNQSLKDKAKQTQMYSSRYTCKFNNETSKGIDIDQLIKDCQKNELTSLSDKINNLAKLQKLKNVASNMILQTLEGRRFKKMNNFHYKIINDAATAINKPTEGIMKYYFVQRIVSFLHLREINLFWPNNVYIVYWDLIMMIISIIAFFAFPVKIAFNYSYQESMSSNIFLFLIPIIFIFFDICSMLNRAYFKDGEIEDDRKNIAKNYFENHSITDLMTLAGLIISEVFQLNYFSFLIITRFVNIKRSYKKVFQEYYHFEGMYPIFSILFNLIMLICTVAHFCGCGFYFISNEFRNDSDPTTWIDTQELEFSSDLKKYLEAVYFSFITMVTVGYGDVSPKNSREKIYCIIMTMVSCGVFAYAVNTIGQIISSLQQRSAQQKRDKYILVSYMRSKNINRNLQMRMLKYLDFKHSQVDKTAEQAQVILNSMIPKNLRDQFYEQYYGSLIKESPFFHMNFSKKLLASLSQHLCDKTFVSGEYLFKQNEVCDYIYILLKGKVEIIYQREHKQFTAAQICNNQVLGLESILSDKDYSYSARICQSSHILFVNKFKFFEIIQQFPNDFEFFNEMKHKSQFSSDSLTKCYSCKGLNHEQQFCPVVNYRPNKYILVGKHDQTQSNTRQRYYRAHNLRFSSYQDKLSTMLIVRCVRINLILELLQGYEVDFVNIDKCLNEELSDKQFFSIVPKFQPDKQVEEGTFCNKIMQQIKQNEKIEEEFLQDNQYDEEEKKRKQKAEQQKNLQVIDESINENSLQQDSSDSCSISITDNDTQKIKNKIISAQSILSNPQISLKHFKEEEEDEIMEISDENNISLNDKICLTNRKSVEKKQKTQKTNFQVNNQISQKQLQSTLTNINEDNLYSIQINQPTDNILENSSKKMDTINNISPIKKKINQNMLSPQKQDFSSFFQKEQNSPKNKSQNSIKKQDKKALVKNQQKKSSLKSQNLYDQQKIQKQKINSKTKQQSTTIIKQQSINNINQQSNTNIQNQDKRRRSSLQVEITNNINNLRKQSIENIKRASRQAIIQNPKLQNNNNNQSNQYSFLSISDFQDDDIVVDRNIKNEYNNMNSVSDEDSNFISIPSQTQFTKKRKDSNQQVVNIHENLRKLSKQISTRNGLMMHNAQIKQIIDQSINLNEQKRLSQSQVAEKRLSLSQQIQNINNNVNPNNNAGKNLLDPNVQKQTNTNNNLNHKSINAGSNNTFAINTNNNITKQLEQSIQLLNPNNQIQNNQNNSNSKEENLNNINNNNILQDESSKQHIYDFMLVDKYLYDYEFTAVKSYIHFFPNYNQENVLDNLKVQKNSNEFIVIRKHNPKKSLKKPQILQQNIKNIASNQIQQNRKSQYKLTGSINNFE